MSSALGTPPAAIRYAQITAIFLSASLAGANLSLSAFVAPRILESPVPLMLRQWLHTYATGKVVFPPLCVATGAVYFYLANRLGLAGAVGKAYLAAGLLAAGIVPYTGALMMPVNNRLEARAAGVAATEEEEETAWVAGEGSRYLVDRWATLNLGRSVMLALAAATGLVYSL